MAYVRTILILASGHGTRMQELTKGNYPKQLVPINGVPKIQYTLQAIPKCIERILMVIGPMGKKIQDFCGTYYEGRPITYLEQPECDGTAKAVLKAKDYIEEPFLVINGDDIYLKKDLELMTQCLWAMLGYKKTDAGRIGQLVVDKNHHLQDIALVQDPSEEVIVCTGTYTLFPTIFEAEPVQLRGKKEYGLPQTLLQMVKRKEIDIVVPLSSFWLPVNKPEDLGIAEKALQHIGQ